MSVLVPPAIAWEKSGPGKPLWFLLHPPNGIECVRSVCTVSPKMPQEREQATPTEILFETRNTKNLPKMPSNAFPAWTKTSPKPSGRVSSALSPGPWAEAEPRVSETGRLLGTAGVRSQRVAIPTAQDKPPRLGNAHVPAADSVTSPARQGGRRTLSTRPGGPAARLTSWTRASAPDSRTITHNNYRRERK